MTDGLKTLLDPARLDLAGEIVALTDGRMTYDLHPDRIAVYRTAHRIAADSPLPVHAEHRCHAPLTDTGPAPAQAPVPRTAPLPDTPPF